ncbi:MAG TPA: glutamine amidotransferase [Acidobacteriota bacterium]|nr:glutamine amidotransferase [Acidobacteriota bacterium]
MEEIFAFFLKYRPFYFSSGDFTLQAGWPWWTWLLLLIGLPAVFYWTYRRRWMGSEGGRIGWVLLALRTAFFLLLAFVLARPALVLSSLQPKENLLALIVDNSLSMGLSDADTGRKRGDDVIGKMRSDTPFTEALDEKFFLRRYAFDARVQRLEEGAEPTFDGNQTNIGAGLSTVLSETRNLPLGGIVLFSDGADTSSRNFSQTLAELKARKIPVHTVGVGPETLSQDVEIVQVSAPRTLLPETTAAARVTLRHSGFGGSRVQLQVREGNSLVDSRVVLLPRDSDTTTVEVLIRPQTEGLKTYEFSLEPLQGEEISENNVRTALVEVQNRLPRILYVEGHPRWEFKFIRQSLREDENIRLETLLRTAPNKLYRQGIESETTLAAGFPTGREELFSYDAIIFGSIESSFFTFNQMELVRDFVSQRGGGFLMLGGSKSFQAGAYRNTPIEDILPVWLQDDQGEAVRSAAFYRQGQGQAGLTQFGEGHPAMQLMAASQQDGGGREEDKWDQLPLLVDWNPVSETKPGAVVLADVSPADERGQRPLLVFQRFGRGQGLALTTGSTWLWQMQQENEDQSHETFWRQVMRWLVSTAKDPVTVESDRETYSSAEPVQIRAEVRDQAYRAINDAQVEAFISSPGGSDLVLPLQWDSQEEGVYRATYMPEEDGLHEIRVEARPRSAQAEIYGDAAAHFIAAGGAREYFDPVRKTDFLRKLAKETGGNYYNMAEVDDLPEEIVYTPATASVVEIKELWDMPINLLLLLALAGGEWVLRKRQGAI